MLSNTTLLIQPGRFIASRGKLDSNLRYIQRVEPPAAYDSVFPIGKTIDLPTRGIRYEMDGMVVSVGTSSSFVSQFFRIVV